MQRPAPFRPRPKAGENTFGHRFSDSRRGFTLTELLVVIAIIATLITLLIPAVQSSREAAWKTECINHLKQLGLAFHNHEEQFGFYPSGGWSFDSYPTYVDGVPVVGADQKAGWGFQILPFIEQSNLWKSDPETAIGTLVPIFFCPARRGPQTVMMGDDYQPQLTGKRIRHALCDYAAGNREGTGIVRQYEPIRRNLIVDGMSYTLFIGDKRLNLRKLGRKMDDDNEGYTAGWNEDTVRRTEDAPLQDYYGGGSDDGEKIFGSSHPGVFNAVFGDGSVHSISYGIDLTLFSRLGNISDGEKVNLDF